MDGQRPYLVIILIQTIYAGMFMLSKAAFNQGMNSMVFVFYRQAAATIFLIPIAIILERKRAPPLSLVAFCKIFMLSLFGITASLNVYGIALVYTSATLAAATSNTLPVITFFLAVLLRMENVKLRTLAGFAKIVGVVLVLAGAATLALYKGPHWNPTHHHPLRHHSEQGSVHSSSSSTWIKGCFLLLTSNMLWGLWLVLQVKILESYPSKLLSTALQCLLSTIQSLLIAIAFERKINTWKLHFDVGLVAVAYCGIVVTGVAFYLQAWCIEKRGPVFLAMSTPLSLIITIFCSTAFLGETIYMGSVLWGKSTEKRVANLELEDAKNKEQGAKKLVAEDEKECLEII